MSLLAQRLRAAVDAYKAAHPDVDWDCHLVMLRSTWEDGTYSFEAVGHRYESPQDRARWNRCCAPNCSTHGERP